ncbi:MAG: undecaprenyl-diphosphate phosphatase [Minisyncoccales bacterium]|jgi:undecaprenyl-diphosphatase
MWKYILLGALQGIFEWLPISSEGVVALFSKFLIKDFNAVDLAIFLHFGTFFVVLIYFWKDWIKLISFKDNEFLKFFIITTIISGGLGFLIYDFAKQVVMGGGLLLLMGLGLFLTSFFQRKQINFSLDKKLAPYALGTLQGLSAIPGVSRSGSTIFGLSFFEKDPYKILKVSYLLSAPVVLGASIYLYLKNPDIVMQGGWIALIFSFIFGFISLKSLLKLSQRIDFSKFTLIFGIICILGALLEFLI